MCARLIGGFIDQSKLYSESTHRVDQQETDCRVTVFLSLLSLDYTFKGISAAFQSK